MTVRITVPQHQILKLLQQKAAEQSVQVCIVGGIVRDLLLGHSLHDRDMDFLIEGDARHFATTIQKIVGGELKIFDRFFTAKILNPPDLGQIDELDFASSRTERYAQPGKFPTVKLASLIDDLRRRDFTINAMAIPIDALLENCTEQREISESIASVVVDQFGGWSDLKSGTIRVIHNQSFRDDPTRILRGYRYCVRIQGAFDSDTGNLVQEALQDNVFQSISRQRVWNELVKLIEEETSAEAFRRLSEDGVLGVIEMFKGVNIPQFIKGLERIDAHTSAVQFASKTEAAQYLIALLLPEGKGEKIFIQHGLSRKRSVHLLEVARQQQALLSDPDVTYSEALYCLATAKSGGETLLAQQTLARLAGVKR